MPIKGFRLWLYIPFDGLFRSREFGVHLVILGFIIGVHVNPNLRTGFTLGFIVELGAHFGVHRGFGVHFGVHREFGAHFGVHREFGVHFGVH